jgi:RimJ/RimL family protein N-acetyltransferase
VVCSDVARQDGRVEALEIRTDELLLRAWRATDAEAVHQACQDPVLASWSHLPAPFPMADAERFVADMTGLLAADKAVPMAIFAGGRLVGSVDLRGLDPKAKIAELGYWSAPWARGRRVTERAARALLTWAFQTLGLVRVDWRATVGNHASRLIGLRLGFRMIGIRPGAAGRPDEWTAALQPAELTARGHELPDAVRRQARVFGGAPPVLAAGPVRLRPLADRDRPAITAAYQDPEIIRWYGVPVPYTDENARRLIRQVAPNEFARGVETILAIAGPDDAWAGTIDLRVAGGDPRTGEVGFLVAPHARGRGYAPAALRAITGWGFDALGLVRVQWRAEAGNDASRRVAVKAGFTMEGLLRQSLEEDGRRYDCWVGSMLRSDRAVPGPE